MINKEKIKNLSKNKIVSPTDIKISPLVRSLIGVVILSKDYDYKNDYSNYLIQKYS